MKDKPSIEGLLAERTRIDDLIDKQYRKEIAVMFTDIVSFTAYFEQRGDISGRALLKQHMDILFPKIEESGGKVIKTIGDGLMVAFKNPEHAVFAAISMQNVLHKYNKHREERERIIIRIGINYGTSIVEDNDIFGDVVNTAARILSLAEGYQILISESVFKSIKDREEIDTRTLGTKEVKGKLEGVGVHEVIWSKEVGRIGAPSIVGKIYRDRLKWKIIVPLLFITAIPIFFYLFKDMGNVTPISSSKPMYDKGYIFVESNPAGAHVYIDGKDTGNTTPYTFEVDVGTHEIKVEKEGYDGWIAQIRVEKGKRLSLNPTFVR